MLEQKKGKLDRTIVIKPSSKALGNTTLFKFQKNSRVPNSNVGDFFSHVLNGAASDIAKETLEDIGQARTESRHAYSTEQVERVQYHMVTG